MQILNPIRNERGIVLVTGLLFLAVLMTLSTTSVVITSNDATISRNYNNAVQAFNNAEAGVQYAIGLIEDGLENGTFTLPSNLGDTVAITDPSTDTVPGTYNFSLSVITKSAANGYTFTSTGDGQPNPPASTAQAVIEATFERGSGLSYGVFGDQKVEIKNSTNIYSYDHNVTPSPTPLDSTGEADLGSNGHLEIKSNAYIDGDAALGDDGAGTDATIEIKTGVTINGDSGVDVDRVDPDPLGVIGGEYESKFTEYSSSNDNNLASPAISGTEIYLDVGETMTLNGKAGGANYYLTEINLKNSATLNIDASAGPVNIFLAGKFEAKVGSVINVSGAPSDFSVFSNSTDNVEFKHGTTFKGFIYAPYAKVEMKNSAEVYGAIWGRDTEIKESATVYFDISLKDKIQSNDLSLVTWENVR